MLHPEDVVRMRHMLDHAREAAALARGAVRGDLDSKRTLCLALVRLLEIVGEAASRVSKGARDECPAIPWSQIVSLRNRLIHGYDSIDLDILWEILTGDLPKLIDELRKAIPIAGP
jgi:uncharacterized protein with HEPN domain